MHWESFYFICFLIGLFMSAFSLLGVMGHFGHIGHVHVPHVPHASHLPHGGGAHAAHPATHTAAGHQGAGQQLPFPDRSRPSRTITTPTRRWRSRSPRFIPVCRSPPTWKRWSRKSMPFGWATHPAGATIISTWLRRGWPRDFPPSATSRSAAPWRGPRKSWSLPEAQGAAHVGEHLPLRVGHGSGAAMRDAGEFGPIEHVRPGCIAGTTSTAG